MGHGLTEADIENLFTYHPPADELTVQTYKELREAGKRHALTILRLTPSCPDQTAAIRKVREAVMTGNAAVACNSWRQTGGTE